MPVKTMDGRVLELGESWMRIKLFRGGTFTVPIINGITKSTPLVVTIEPGSKRPVDIMSLAAFKALFQEQPPAELPTKDVYGDARHPSEASWEHDIPHKHEG
jgi:hypothetical protein